MYGGVSLPEARPRATSRRQLMCWSHYTLHPRGTTSSQVAAEPRKRWLADGRRQPQHSARCLVALVVARFRGWNIRAAGGTGEPASRPVCVRNPQRPRPSSRALSRRHRGVCSLLARHNRWLLRSPFCRKRSVCRRQRRNSPLLPTVIDPRTAVADGARFLLSGQRYVQRYASHPSR